MSRLIVSDLSSRAAGLAEQAKYSLNFDLQGPDCLGLTGPSGSGKSLLLRAIADLDPSVGEVMLDAHDRDNYKAHEWRQHVAYLPADSAWWSDTVGDHFTGLAPYGLASLGFGDDIMHWSVARLSSGERQILALSRALARSPSVLLLDEPTSSLDAERTGHIEQLVWQYAQQHAAPVVWISHDREQLARVARHSLLLDGHGGIKTLA